MLLLLYSGTSAGVSPRVIITTPLTVEEAIRAGHTRHSRMLLLDGSDLQPTALFPDAVLLDYNVSLSRERHIRRQASGSVLNADLAFTPVGPSAPLWSGRLVRIETGVELDQSVEYRALATLILDGVAASTDSASVSFSGSSRLKLLEVEFPEPLSFDAGTRLRDVVRTCCALVGLGTADALYDLDDGGAELAALLAFTTQDQMLSTLVDVCSAHALDLADDAEGRVWMRPLPTVPGTPVWDFSPGTGSTVTAIEARYTGPVRIYNRTIVRGVGPDLEPIEAEARNLNPLSPTYNPLDGSGPFGDRPYAPIFDGRIGTPAQAQAVADAVLYQIMAYQIDIDAGSVVVPGIEDRDLVRLSASSRTGFDDLVVLDTVGIGKTGPMTMSGRVSRSPVA
jgi:hypothetical protein